jgi:hypothetical protein
MAPTVYPIHGTLTFDPEGKVGSLAFTVDGETPPIPPNPPAGDAIDLSQAILGAQSPDVRGWPARSHLSLVGMGGYNEGEVMALDFDRRWGPNAWPIVQGPEGEIQYTLWCGCNIGGKWYIAGSILCISRGQNDNYVPTGPALRVGQLPGNWYYFSGAPLATYQPQPGELVAWFLTAGVQRRTDIHALTERTQVVLVPFQPGTFTF